METTDNGILKIYASTTDRIGSRILYEYIVYEAKEAGITGITVFRGIMGFGPSSEISSSKYWELTEKLPIAIELVDEISILKDFYSRIEEELISMPKGCLVTLEPVKVMLQKKGRTD